MTGRPDPGGETAGGAGPASDDCLPLGEPPHPVQQRRDVVGVDSTGDLTEDDLVIAGAMHPADPAR